MPCASVADFSLFIKKKKEKKGDQPTPLTLSTRFAVKEFALCRRAFRVVTRAQFDQGPGALLEFIVRVFQKIAHCRSQSSIS